MCGSFPGLLIGRTAVHSGKDPAFVAYDQFLSTGILQPLSRGEVRCGSKPVKLGTSKCFQVCPRKRTSLPILELLRPSTLSERRHRGFVRQACYSANPFNRNWACCSGLCRILYSAIRLERPCPPSPSTYTRKSGFRPIAPSASKIKTPSATSGPACSTSRVWIIVCSSSLLHRSGL